MARIVALHRAAEERLEERPVIVVHVQGLEANLKAVLVRVECPGLEAAEEMIQPEEVHDRVTTCMEATGIETVIVAAPDTLPADDETLMKVLNGLTE